MSKQQLQENLNHIEELIQEATKKRQINQSKPVKLVAVTKYTTPEMMEKLYDLGVRDFGENRNKQLLERMDHFKEQTDIVWHFIGNLQTRQVRTIINDIDYLHSLDRMRLANEIQKRATQPVKCFLQLNISKEESKTGFAVEELDSVIKQLADFDKIQIVGLMTMAPYDAQPNELKAIFNQLAYLQQQIQALNLPYAPCDELSMGMSGDFVYGIEEGATVIRVGSALFKEN
ncbi:YggS family pyridoxal phosphate-dependent enzyme [Dolosicoccus paucivorans]|uniref:Pyridoxal phosphate homeostasis protein n=1 Tax=Dolosicoccus paucivorans TaxID=84521 RepID=A0A2N6SQD2_9LACT|nr:YggS family pyridoxal phosphate-dependent enzyme [Dolosicoccus paucivorans]PMC59275.1 YggS family pyridoxal phosphate-dependent enzyme [Dolosicoccus paucivorans]